MYNLSYLPIPGEPIYVILMHLHLTLESFKALIYACALGFCVHFRVTFYPMNRKKFRTRIEKDILKANVSRIFGIENKTARIAKKRNEET